MNGIKLNPLDKLRLTTELRNVLVKIEAMETETRCDQCTHFQPMQVDRSTGEVKSAARCAKWKSEIPADVLPNGCEAWDFDDIPF